MEKQQGMAQEVKYETKEDTMAAIFLALGIPLIGTRTEMRGSRQKIYFVFDINKQSGKALEILIRREDPRLKVIAGAIGRCLDLVRSWLYLSRDRQRTGQITSSEIQRLVEDRIELSDEQQLDYTKLIDEVIRELPPEELDLTEIEGGE